MFVLAIRIVEDTVLSTPGFDSTENEIVLYPNPVANDLYLNQQVKSILVTDMIGKKIALVEHTNYIDCSNFSEGIYVLTIKDVNGTLSTKKMIKQ